ncbi:hypothetical protein F511_29838 [Dorcoceras hygrometricum]|uniref:Uncharacterized protein n=1 Tax=Dorcoceras hygrometricum TaxID=472368 RepID=A0A2Z7CGM2_9LAMI|nr:hypothetical protein F511_29838 [Dorcoceras hygrometricum]
MDIVIWTRARWAGPSPLLVYLIRLVIQITQLLKPNPKARPPPLPLLPRRRRCRRFPPSAAARRPPLIDRTCFDQFFEENPSVLISSGHLVQADEGVSLLVVDLIDESTAAYREEPVFL